MKRLIIVLLVLGCVSGTFAQKQLKGPALPANMAKWNGQDSDIILYNPAVRARLKKLLGKKNYRDFFESFETINPVEKSGNFLFAKGCLIHGCGHVESAIAIDLVNQTIHVGIYRQGLKNRYFNEKQSQTPWPIRDWGSNLKSGEL